MLSASIMGPWLERHGPKSAGILGASLFFVGNLITALGCHVRHISLVYIGYGIFGGLGLGISYISPVSALQKWFPDRRGVAAGLAVSGFGAGSIVMAKVPDPLAAAVGYVVNGLDVWAMPVDEGANLSDVEEHDDDYSVSEKDVMTLKNSSSQYLQPPASPLVPGSPVSSAQTKRDSERRRSSYNPKINNGNRSIIGHGYDPSTTMNLMESLYSREYRLMYIMFLGNTMAGVVIISRLANIATDIFGQSKDTASTIVSINGGFNLIGRLLFASVSDRIGRKNSYLIMLTSQAIILASLPIVMAHKVNWAFLMTIWILTACYGGGFGCIPAFLCDMFGPCNIGALHGIILTSWSLSSVGAGLLFTAVYNHLLEDKGYTVHNPFIYAINLYWILGCVCIGLVVTVFVRTGVRDRLLPNIPGELFHIRVFGRILRVGRQYLAERDLDMSEQGAEHGRKSTSSSNSSGSIRGCESAKTMLDHKQQELSQKQELQEEPYHHHHHDHNSGGDYDTPAASADYYHSTPTAVTSSPLQLSGLNGVDGNDGRSSDGAPVVTGDALSSSRLPPVSGNNWA
ncbi:hypothetical protein BGW41_003582 [Actinomortierella wolfii]|nr:hypothetical protein BGW41_003582 [Actinomortierella wolfii]